MIESEKKEALRELLNKIVKNRILIEELKITRHTLTNEQMRIILASKHYRCIEITRLKKKLKKEGVDVDSELESVGIEPEEGPIENRQIKHKLREANAVIASLQNKLERQFNNANLQNKRGNNLYAIITHTLIMCKEKESPETIEKSINDLLESIGA